MQTLTTTAVGHGGAREGAGRPVAYPLKGRDPYAMALTAVGRARLAALKARTGLGQNDIFEHLLRECPDIEIPATAVYGPKVYPPLAVRLTSLGRDALFDIQARTGRSWTDIGEALLLAGRRLTFPSLPQPKAKPHALRGRGRRAGRTARRRR